MPWHRNDGCDFSDLEVNEVNKYAYAYEALHFCRKVNNIRGFSRETLIVLAANIHI